MGHYRASFLSILKFCQTTNIFFKLECVKIMLKKFYTRGPKIKPKFLAASEITFREGVVIHPPCNNNEGLWGIVNNMRMVLDTQRSGFGSQQWLWFNIWFILTLYYKMWQMLLQNATGLLQNVEVIKKCNVYCKMLQ